MVTVVAKFYYIRFTSDIKLSGKERGTERGREGEIVLNFYGGGCRQLLFFCATYLMYGITHQNEKNKNQVTKTPFPKSESASILVS